MVKLTTLELLKSCVTFFGPKMLAVFRDADLYSSLLKLYSVFAFSDILL